MGVDYSHGILGGCQSALGGEVDLVATRHPIIRHDVNPVGHPVTGSIHDLDPASRMQSLIPSMSNLCQPTKGYRVWRNPVLYNGFVFKRKWMSFACQQDRFILPATATWANARPRYFFSYKPTTSKHQNINWKSSQRCLWSYNLRFFAPFGLLGP
jgi:hypothetical protein